MAYQLLWDTQCQFHPCKRKLVVLFNSSTRYKELHASTEGISSKVIVIERLEIELAYYDVAVPNVGHHATKATSLCQLCHFPRWMLLRLIFLYKSNRRVRDEFNVIFLQVQANQQYCLTLGVYIIERSLVRPFLSAKISRQCVRVFNSHI